MYGCNSMVMDVIWLLSILILVRFWISTSLFVEGKDMNMFVRQFLTRVMFVVNLSVLVSWQITFSCFDACLWSWLLLQFCYSYSIAVIPSKCSSSTRGMYIHQIGIVKLLMEFIRSLNRNEQALVAPAAWIEWNAGVEGEDQGQRAGEWLTMQWRTIMRIGGSWCDRPCKGDWVCTSECCASVAGMVLTAQAIVVEKPKKKSPANPPTKGLPLWWWLGFLTLTSDKFIANAEKYEEIRNGRHS